MNKDQKKFIKEGIPRYKQATEVYFSFRKEMQNALQEILKKRKQWSGLQPDYKSIKSTNFGQDYPLLNARVVLQKKEESLILVIAVNWYESETDFPFFTVWLENENSFSTLLKNYNWNDKYDAVDARLIYRPDPENYDLSDIIDGLLDEYLTALGSFE